MARRPANKGKKCKKWGRSNGKRVCRSFGAASGSLKGSGGRKKRCLKWSKNGKRKCIKRAKR
jgi:hypothetical protein